MQYRILGDTGVKVSVLGFGAMRLLENFRGSNWLSNIQESKKLIHCAFDMGVNYIDTGFLYSHGFNEYIVGKAIKGYRDNISISTKSPLTLIKKTEDYRRILEKQLKVLNVNYIDFYHFHSINRDNWRNVILKYNLLDEALKAKNRGLIKHISFSFHDRPEFLVELINIGLFETVLCQYNLLDKSNNDAISYAREKGLGVIVMGPLGGGRIMAMENKIKNMIGMQEINVQEIAFNFVLGNSNVSCVLSGMSSIEMLIENNSICSNIKTFDLTIWNKISNAINEIIKSNIFQCTKCNYCMPCPYGLDIPYILNTYSKLKINGLNYTINEMEKIIGISIDNEKPFNCQDCGLCEIKCPQRIFIRSMFKQIVKDIDKLNGQYENGVRQ